MNLLKYYKENKGEINSSIMEIASDLAVGRLMQEHEQPFEAFVEPDDPDNPESGTHYKAEYQGEYNRYYDEEYNRLTDLMKFDICSQDGVAHRAVESKATEFKSAYVTVRLDIENITGAEITEQDIDELICEMDYHFTAPDGDIVISDTEICGRNE